MLDTPTIDRYAYSVMNLQINGEPRDVSAEEPTVAELLDALEIDQRQGLAVAVNDRVVTRSKWEEATVGEGDAVEIIRATQGG